MGITGKGPQNINATIMGITDNRLITAMPTK